MDNGVVKSLGEKVGLKFKYIPDFAAYILHNELEAFVSELLQRYQEIDIPLLRFFTSIDIEQRRSIVTGSSREMLTFLASNNTAQYIKQALDRWRRDQLPQIRKEQIHAQDISLINYVRGSVFRKFISAYTTDICTWQHLVEELHRFAVIYDSEAFSSYLDLQKEQIQKMNAALQAREQQLLEAQRIGQVGSFDWDLVGEQSSFTPQMFRIFGMDDLSRFDKFFENVHPEDQKKVNDAIQNALATGDFECEYRYDINNSEKIILARGKVLFENERPRRMIGTVTDVTERHEIIKRLQESEKLHKQAQAITHIGNWSWFIQDNKITWSDEMYRIYGLEPQSEKITFDRFMSFVDPEDRGNRIAQIRKSLEALTVEEYHFRITAANGERKVLRGKGEVLADGEHAPTVMLGTCQDVTREFALTQQLRERERYLEELNRSLQHANNELSRTNEELESFNFIASHDLQEPLRKIQIYSNRILENGFADLPEILKDYFTRINNASKRMQKLIEDFLAFSQTFNTTQLPEDTDLNKLMEEIKAELVTRIEEKQAEIHAENLPHIYAVPFHLKQLITNLISNALKYTKPDVRPRIIITGSVVSGKDLPEGSADPNLNYTMVSVKDNGIGFEPKYSTKIFELFQRLHSKNAYSGTGIGLALCKKIVRNMDGFILAHSEPGKGSVFTFYIPDIHPQRKSVPGINSVQRAHQGG